MLHCSFHIVVVLFRQFFPFRFLSIADYLLAIVFASVVADLQLFVRELPVPMPLLALFLEQLVVSVLPQQSLQQSFFLG